MLEQLRYYAPYAWRFVVTRNAGLLICGLAVTDRCNLHCRACHVSNNGAGDLSYDQALGIMQSAYDRGCREIYFTGGEPMLWREGERDLEDLVRAARLMGYFHVHVYTNGTLGLHSSADLMWVSVDGLPEVYRTRRGDHFHEVERLLAMKAAGLPLINSRAGLKALASGDWPRRTPIALVADAEGESLCCRATDDVCPDCGYSACTEISAAQRLRPSAVAGMVRYL